MEPHWTDNVTAFPIFTTRIDGTGRRGNINDIAFTAASYLHSMDGLSERGDKLLADVRAATSYAAAIALVERWFPVDRDDAP